MTIKEWLNDNQPTTDINDPYCIGAEQITRTPITVDVPVWTGIDQQVIMDFGFESPRISRFRRALISEPAGLRLAYVS